MTSIPSRETRLKWLNDLPIFEKIDTQSLFYETMDCLVFSPGFQGFYFDSESELISLFCDILVDFKLLKFGQEKVGKIWLEKENNWNKVPRSLRLHFYDLDKLRAQFLIQIINYKNT